MNSSGGRTKSADEGPVYACSVTNYLRSYHPAVHYLLDYACIGNKLNPQRDRSNPAAFGGANDDSAFSTPRREAPANRNNYTNNYANNNAASIISLFIIPTLADIKRLEDVIETRAVNLTADIFQRHFMFKVTDGDPRDELKCTLVPHRSASRNDQSPATIDKGAINGIPVKMLEVFVQDNRSNPLGYVVQATKDCIDKEGNFVGVKGGTDKYSVSGGTLHVNKNNVMSTVGILSAIHKHNLETKGSYNNIFLCATNPLWAQIVASKGRNTLIFRDWNPLFDMAMLLGLGLSGKGKDLIPQTILDKGINIVEITPHKFLYNVAPPPTLPNAVNLDNTSGSYKEVIDAAEKVYKNVFGDSVIPHKLRLRLDFNRFLFAAKQFDNKDGRSDICNFNRVLCTMLELREDSPLPSNGWFGKDVSQCTTAFLESPYFLYMFRGSSERGELRPTNDVVNNDNAINMADFDRLLREPAPAS